MDITAPIVTCPRDIRRRTTNTNGIVNIFWPEPVAFDDSGNAYLNEKSHTSGSAFPVGVTNVTYSYSDLAGNVGRCSFTITVESGKYLRCDMKVVKNHYLSTNRFNNFVIKNLMIKLEGNFIQHMMSVLHGFGDYFYLLDQHFVSI